MNFRAITTCHEKGWQSYGRRMAKTFLMYWKDVPLTFYTEGNFKPDYALLRHIQPLPDWQVAFKQRHKGNPAMNGRGKRYDLLHDAVRFSHKVGATIDAIERTLADSYGIKTPTSAHTYLSPQRPEIVVWVDADVMTHAPVTVDFLTQLVPDWENTAVAWLNRDHKYPECGFVMFNCAHPAMEALIETWKRLYTHDQFVHLLNKGWTDCHTLQAAVEMADAPTASLSGGFTNLGHPFVNGPLGAVMDHLKGDRKLRGRSARSDLTHRRLESYWR